MTKINKLKQKWQSFKRFIGENPRDFLRFEIGLAVGAGLIILVHSVITLSTILISILLGFLAILFLITIKFLGCEEMALEFWERFLNSAEKINSSETMGVFFPSLFDLVPTVIEFTTEMSKVLTHFGKAIFANLAVLFPVLWDIQIDIDWLHISFALLVRTFLNIVQFAIMFYIYRKIKAKIKREVEEVKSEIMR